MAPILFDLLRASRQKKSAILASLDVLAIVIAFMASVWIGDLVYVPIEFPALLLGVALILAAVLGLHRHRLRIFDSNVYSRAILLSLSSAIGFGVLATSLNLALAPISMVIFGITLLFALTLYRVVAGFLIQILSKDWQVTPSSLLNKEGEANEVAILPLFDSRTVMVTGAGGSIGSEICRQLLQHNPKKLVLFEISEAHLFAALESLPKTNAEIVPILGDVTSAQILRRVFAAHRIDIVLHAAAYKHVPMVEQNEISGIRNNVFGTRNLALLCQEFGVSRFLLISTDKAVRPTNIMGASKRMAELVIQDLAARSTGTIFSMVRFGNVMGSSGSVIPHFYQQIQSGGPVTVTHANITRYFMTVPEAADLVLKSAGISKGGEVFLLDMGAPVRIYDLAKRMIGLSGKTLRNKEHPDGDIAIEISGLRPGEKIYEELLISNTSKPTEIPKISKAQEPHLSELETTRMIRTLSAAITTQNTFRLREAVQIWLPEYQPPEADQPMRKAS